MPPETETQEETQQTETEEESTETQETQETEETSEAETQEDDENLESNENEEELELKLKSKQGLQLLEALSDPNTSRTVLEQLVKAAGLEIVEPGRKQTQTQEKSIEEELAQALGDDWKFLGDKLGPIISKKLKAIESKVESKFEANETANQQTSMKAAEKKFFEEDKSRKRYFKKMRSLAQEYPPPSGKDFGDYLGDLYKLASVGSGSISDTVEKERSKRAKRNRSESEVKNSGRRKTTPKEPTTPGTLAEAVEYAKKTIRREDFE